MKHVTTAAAALLMALSATAFAAKPTSIAFNGDGTTADGNNFAKYVVKCSNGTSRPLTAWDNRNKWCIGEESQENCHRKQLKAAKEACQIN